MSSLGTPKGNGQAYWRSLEELSDTPEFRSFMHREFPSGASELLDGTDRRHFLRIMGGSMGWPAWASRGADVGPRRRSFRIRVVQKGRCPAR